jgi:hypothetical protein
VIVLEIAEKDKVGRPCKYESYVEPYLDKIYEWLKQGYTDYSIAEQLGIHESTWIRYKEKYDNLTSLYTRARTERNRLVMNKMYERATGYKHKDLFIAQYQGQIVEKEIEKYYPPDVNAADLFLRNNDPEYKSAKSEGITINNNTFQLPQIAQQIQLLKAELDSIDAVKEIDYTVE